MSEHETEAIVAVEIRATVYRTVYVPSDLTDAEKVKEARRLAALRNCHSDSEIPYHVRRGLAGPAFHDIEICDNAKEWHVELPQDQRAETWDEGKR